MNCRFIESLLQLDMLIHSSGPSNWDRSNKREHFSNRYFLSIPVYLFVLWGQSSTEVSQGLGGLLFWSIFSQTPLPPLRLKAEFWNHWSGSIFLFLPFCYKGIYVTTLIEKRGVYTHTKDNLFKITCLKGENWHMIKSCLSNQISRCPCKIVFIKEHWILNYLSCSLIDLQCYSETLSFKKKMINSMSFYYKFLRESISCKIRLYTPRMTSQTHWLMTCLIMWLLS